MTMRPYTPQRWMYNQARNELLTLAYVEDHGLIQLKVTPPAPAGVNEIVYFDNIVTMIVTKVWTVTELDIDNPSGNWNGFGFTCTDENGVSKAFDIRTS